MAEHHKKALQHRGSDPLHPQWDHRQPQPTYKKLPPAYEPGEGYSINVIPFAGVAPRKGLHFEKDVENMYQRALEVGKQVRAKAKSRPENYTQRLPVPERYAAALAAGGDLLEDLETEGCSVSVEPHEFEWDGQPWRLVVLQGHEKCVRASALQLMACMVPPLKRLNA
jgi:hypothetical protein